MIDRSSGLTMGSGQFAQIWRLEEGGQWRIDRDVRSDDAQMHH